MSAIDWFRFVALLGGELFLLTLIAMVLQICFRSPQAQRSIWQAAFTSMGLLTIIELTGVREKLQWPVWKPHHHYFVTATTLPAQTQDAPALQNTEPRSAIVPEPSPKFIAWPARIWLTGFILLCARSFASRIWLGMRSRSATHADEESLWLLAQLQTSLRLSGLRAQSWTGLRGPVAFGVLRPTIALPRNFSERYSIGERQAMLAHEMAHLAARDPFWFLISDAVIALAWWHPAVWLARRKLHLASELCADEASALIPGGPSVLAECLIRFGRELTGPGPTRSLAAGGNGLKSQLAIRIANLLREPKTWRSPAVWLNRMTQLSATVVAAASIFLPTQTGISGSILALMISSAPSNAAIPLVPSTHVNTINQISKERDRRIAVNEVPANVAPITFNPVSDRSHIAGAPGIISKTNRPIAITVRDNSPIISSNTPVPQVLAKMSAVPASSSQLINEGRTEAKSSEKRSPSVTLKIKTIFLTENESDGLGLDWLFGSTPTETDSMETSHDWKDLQRGIILESGLEMNNHHTSLTVDIVQSGKSVVLNHEQFAALISRIETATRDDVLAAPMVQTVSGREAHVSVLNYQEVVTGVEAKPGNVNYFTDNVGVGFTIDIIPTAKDDNTWRLNAVARHMTFEGYDKPGVEPTIVVPGSKPSKYHQPLPHFRLLETKAEENTAFGETMAIRGPLITETVKIKGHLFVRAKTKTVHQRLYVFVTPSRYPDVNP